MQSTSRKVAYSATFTAVSALAILASRFLPIVATALLVCLVCYFLSFIICGFGYGLITIAASLLTAFFSGGFGTVFIFDLLLFAPYSIIAFFMRKLSYNGAKAVIRVAITVIFVNIVFAIIYFALASYISLDFTVFSKKLGGYAVLAVVLSVVAIITDYLFYQASEYFIKMLKK